MARLSDLSFDSWSLCFSFPRLIYLWGKSRSCYFPIRLSFYPKLCSPFSQFGWLTAFLPTSYLADGLTGQLGSVAAYKSIFVSERLLSEQDRLLVFQIPRRSERWSASVKLWWDMDSRQLYWQLLSSFILVYYRLLSIASSPSCLSDPSPLPYFSIPAYLDLPWFLAWEVVPCLFPKVSMGLNSSFSFVNSWLICREFIRFDMINSNYNNTTHHFPRLLPISDQPFPLSYLDFSIIGFHNLNSQSVLFIILLFSSLNTHQPIPLPLFYHPSAIWLYLQCLIHTWILVTPLILILFFPCICMQTSNQNIGNSTNEPSSSDLFYFGCARDMKLTGRFWLPWGIQELQNSRPLFGKNEADTKRVWE